jgi:Zn finger protein HypA/HybF involved in hydrogenase expression
MSTIITETDPFSNFVICEEFLEDPMGEAASPADNIDTLLSDQHDIDSLEPIQNDINSIMSSEDDRLSAKSEEDQLSEKNEEEPQNDVFVEEFPVQVQQEEPPKEVQRVKRTIRIHPKHPKYNLSQDEVLVQVDRSNKPFKELVKVVPFGKGNRGSQWYQKRITKYKCFKSDCDLLFFTKADRFHHMRVAGHELKYENKEKNYFCYCGATFESKSEENEHIRQNHNVKFKCNTCGSVSFTITGIKYHVKHFHVEGSFSVTLLTKLTNETGMDVFR